jgi:hypothetical protein
MSQSLSQQLTAQFYEWEKLGRGWFVFAEPVELEPEFVPFFRFAPIDEVEDDGLRLPFWDRAANFLEKALGSPQPEESEEADEGVVGACIYHTTEALHGFSLSFPSDTKPFRAQDIEQFLTMLSSTNSHVCFEIHASPDLIRITFVCAESDLRHLESQVSAYFPTCIIQDRTKALLDVVADDKYFAITDFGLDEEFMRPLYTADKFDTDPLTGLYGVLEHLEDKEEVLAQVMFKGAVNPWAESIIAAVMDSNGGSFFTNAPEMPKLTQEKVLAPLFGASIRVMGLGENIESAQKVTRRVATMLTQSSHSTGNKLIPLNNVGYGDDDHLCDVLLRRTHRVGMLLNAKELATFVHYPLAITSKKLERDIQKTKRAPNIAWGHDFCLGTNRHQGFEGIVTIEASQRLKHMHVIGATGTGKSTMLQSSIVQDIMLGNGIAVLDPHGDLIESILPYIPENRYDDVIFIDPSDAEFPVGFNILSAHSDIEKEILASDLVAVFKRLSTSFGDQMHSVLANAILAFVESKEGGTLIDLRRFLIEKPFREQFLKTVSDPSIVYYWQKEYPLLKSSSIGSILTRLDSFLRPKLIRNMVAQKKGLDFESIMDGKKILLMKLSQGLIGAENSYLLGTFFVSKIYQAAMARQAQSKEARTVFYMYIDEFQNFVTPSMSSILSGTRKYGLGCILAHQDMSQLQKYDTELANAVVSNAGTRVCFRIGDIDARRFADGFASFEAQDIQNLGVGQAIARIERPEYDFTISTLVLNDIDTEKAEEMKNTIISLSREKYGTPREEVEWSLEYLREQKAPDTEPPGKKQPVIVPSKKETIQEIKEPEISEKITPVEIIDNKTKDRLVKQKELSEHRYLQMYIKKMAEARGYKASIEEPTPDGNGSVDVSLERNGKRIACEIGMTTTAEWELHNIQKCITAGYDLVVAIAKSRDMVKVMQKEIRHKIEASLQYKVLVMEAEALFTYLDAEITKEASTETRIKGYRVKVEYGTVSEEEMRRKTEAVTKAVVDSIKQKRT